MSILFKALYYLLEAISYMLIARIILSWFPSVRQSKFYEILVQLTEPLLAPVRNLLNKTKAGNMQIDFSVIIVYILISVVQMLIYPYM